MQVAQKRRAAARERANELGLGQSCRTYAITGVTGALVRVARGFLMVGLCVFLGALVFIRPPSAFLKGVVLTALLLATYGIGLLWRRMSARLGMNRCCLYPGGVVVTDLFGQVRNAVAWHEVSMLKLTSGAVLVTAMHRVELVRHGSTPVAFAVLGAQPVLVTALQEQAARNGIPQHNVHFRVS
ncbi:hypothetical protein ACWGLF_08850 [Streptomyces puniciscabiei]